MKYVFLSLMIILSANVQAEGLIVYGDDDREDIFNVQDKAILELSKSVAARVKKYKLEEVGDKLLTVGEPTLISDRFSVNLCKDERFSMQPIVSDCTGFLVGEDILVTAGHCITPKDIDSENTVTRACENHSWVFDYTADAKGNVNTAEINKDNVFDCASVIFATYTADDDYAIVKLDRKVKNRTPLKLNKKLSIKKDQELFMLGHPSGLPMKYTGGAKAFEVEDNYFTTNLDSFGGNSGSPVFNAKTLEVEGILVRGDVDYTPDEFEGESCRRVNTCDEDRSNCKKDLPQIEGEHVSHISKVTAHL